MLKYQGGERSKCYFAPVSYKHIVRLFIFSILIISSKIWESYFFDMNMDIVKNIMLQISSIEDKLMCLHYMRVWTKETTLFITSHIVAYGVYRLADNINIHVFLCLLFLSRLSLSIWQM